MWAYPAGTRGTLDRARTRVELLHDAGRFPELLDDRVVLALLDDSLELRVIVSELDREADGGASDRLILGDRELDHLHTLSPCSRRRHPSGRHPSMARRHGASKQLQWSHWLCSQYPARSPHNDTDAPVAREARSFWANGFVCGASFLRPAGGSSAQLDRLSECVRRRLQTVTDTG